MVTIRDLEGKKTGGIFCLNATSGRDRSNIIFTVPKNSGVGIDTIEVPNTFVPIDLTEQVSRRQLMESSEFRRAVSRGLIELITDEEASQLLTEDGAKEELARLKNSRSAMDSLNQQDGVEVTGNAVDPALSNSEEASVDTKIDGVDAGVVQLMEILKEEGDAISVMNSLRGLGKLSQEDFKYILKHVGEHENIKKYAQRMLN